MKVVNVLVKVLAALAAVVGAAYLIATYGEKIVEWAKKLVSAVPCCKETEEAPAEEAAEEEAPAEEACEACEAAEEAPVEEACEACEAAEETPVEEAPAEEAPAEEAPVEEAFQAAEEDFEA